MSTREKIPMTRAGYAQIEAELKRLKNEVRPEIIKAIAEARDHGDLSENAEYHAAKEQQAQTESRVIELEDKISRAEVIEVTDLSGETVKFGATVTVVDTDTEVESAFQIVGTDEADIRSGLISFTAPLARALIGKGPGDEVEVTTPGGHRVYEILKVEYIDRPMN